MKTITHRAARAQLAATMRQVCRDHAPITITGEGKDAVVMMSLADYEAEAETAYLFRSPANARRLLEAMAQLDAGGGELRHLRVFDAAALR